MFVTDDKEKMLQVVVCAIALIAQDLLTHKGEVVTKEKIEDISREYMRKAQENIDKER